MKSANSRKLKPLPTRREIVFSSLFSGVENSFSVNSTREVRAHFTGLRVRQWDNANTDVYEISFRFFTREFRVDSDDGFWIPSGAKNGRALERRSILIRSKIHRHG